MSAVEMPFGKYRGRALRRIPLDYLDWLLTIELRPWLRLAVQNEIRARVSPRPPETSAVPGEYRDILAAVFDSGFRALAQRCHPDRGGDGDEMRRLLEAREWARRELLRKDWREG